MEARAQAPPGETGLTGAGRPGWTASTIYRCEGEVGGVTIDELVVSAARCWRSARDRKAPVQQQLYALLAPHDCGLLAPAFHSLMTFWQAALGRPFAVGAASLSHDEHLLIETLKGTTQRDRWHQSILTFSPVLDCALTSTRLMIASLANLQRSPSFHSGSVGP